MGKIAVVLAAVLLTGCQGDSVNATCKVMLAKARTNTDTLIVWAAKPSASYMSCGYGYVTGEL